MRYKWKVCILGDASVGKTSLVRHYCEGYFREDYLTTIGVSFLRKEINLNINNENDVPCVLNLWDLGGQTMFSTVRQEYLKGTDGAIILFDLTEKMTLSHLNNWYEDVVRSVGHIPTLIIGNKLDLINYNKNEEVPNIIKKAQKLCSLLKIELFLTSAKTGFHMNEIFELLTKNMIEYYKKD